MNRRSGKIMRMLFTYKLEGVNIGGVNLTHENIGKFDLHPLFKSPIADIYARTKRNKILILHVKEPYRYSRDNEFLSKNQKITPYVDWTEDSLKYMISYIKQRE